MTTIKNATTSDMAQAGERDYSAGEDREACLPWSRDEFEPGFLRAWLAGREAAGREIDIEICEIGCWWVWDTDVYGIRESLGELKDFGCVGTGRFARSPASRGWVHECDLPPDKSKAMYDRLIRNDPNLARGHP